VTANSFNVSTGAFTFIGSDLVPNTPNAWDLGATGHEWRDAYLSGNLTVGDNQTATGDIVMFNSSVVPFDAGKPALQISDQNYTEGEYDNYLLNVQAQQSNNSRCCCF